MRRSPGLLSSHPVPDVGSPTPQPATDDWPFLYLRTGTVAPYYLAGLAFILIFAFAAVFGSARVTSTPIRRSARTSVLGPWKKSMPTDGTLEPYC